MAKLPMLDSPQGEMTTAAPSVGLNPQAQAAGGKMIEQAGDAFSALGQKFDDLRDHSETTKAETEGIYAKNDIQVKAMADPDVYCALDRAKERLSTLGDTLASKITSPDARNAFMEKWQAESASEYVNLETQLRKKQIDIAKANTFEHVEAKMEEFTNAINPAERDKIASDIVGHVKKAVEKQYMTPEQGREYLKTHLDLMHVNQVTTDIDKAEADPNGDKMIKNITENLNKGKSGWYPHLNPKQRDEMLTKARNSEKRIDKAQKINQENIQNSTQDDFFTKAMTNTLTQTEIDNEAHKMSKPYTSTLKDVMKSPLLTAEMKNPSFKEVVKMMEDPKKADVGAIQMKIMQHMADGTLGTGDANLLGTLAIIPQKDKKGTGLYSLDKLMAQKAVDDKASRDRLNVGAIAWKSFSAAFPAINPMASSAVNAMRKFLTKNKDENLKPEDVAKVTADIVKKQRLEDNPNMANAPKDGQPHADAYGNVARYFPDGDLKEEQQETTDEEPEHDTEN